MRLVALTAFVASLALSAPAALAGPAAPAGPPAPAGNGQVVAGETVERHVEALTQKIHWNRTLDEALAQAKRERKIVLWLHMKGDLDGIC